MCEGTYVTRQPISDGEGIHPNSPSDPRPRTCNIHLSRCKWYLQDVKWRVYLYDSAGEYFMREFPRRFSHGAFVGAVLLSRPPAVSAKLSNLLSRARLHFFAR